MVEVNQKGVAVRNLDGSYIFYPGYEPAEDEKCLAIPLDTGDHFLVGVAGNASLGAADPARVMPVQGGGMMAVSENNYPLPLTITTGITSHTVTSPYSQNLGEFKFYWNGSGSLYLSGSSTAVANFSMDDGIFISCSRGDSGWDQDPSFNGSLNITNWSDGGVNLFQQGINTINVSVGSSYGTTTGCSAIYLIQV